ncbi:uncharacterized protein LOC140705774 [Pogona vitticeps]
METGRGYGFSPYDGQGNPWWCQPLPTQIGGVDRGPSLLQDYLLSSDCVGREPERNRSFWGEETMKHKDVAPGTKPKKYNLLTDEELPDPFGPELSDVKVNKTNPFLTVTSTPAIIPADSLGPPSSGKEPNHSGAQRGADQWGGREEMTRMLKTIERQEKMIESLTEQQMLVTRHMMKLGMDDERTPKNNVFIKNGLVAGPAPIRIQKMSASDDPEAYLHTFERVAVAAGWPKEQWTLILVPCLTGLLQEVVDTLSPQEAAQYESVKTAILRTLNLTEEAYRKRFRELKWKPGVHPRTLVQRMKANMTRWIKPEDKSKEQVMEAFVLEHLVTTLSGNLKGWVQKNNPKQLEEAIKLIEDYCASEEAIKEGPAFSGERGRPREKAGTQTQGGGVKRGMDVPGGARPRGRPFEPMGPKPVRPVTVDDRVFGGLVCYGCGTPGHVRRDCPGTDCSWVGGSNNTQEKSGKQVGWEVVAWVNGEKKQALIDTGCGRTLVRDIKLEGVEEGFTVKCIHGDSKTYKTTWAEVKVGEEKRKMKVGIVPGLSREMLLGRDWVGDRTLAECKEVMQGDCVKIEVGDDFLQETTRDHMRMLQQDDATLQEHLRAAREGEMLQQTEERTAHSSGGACERWKESEPSSQVSTEEGGGGCAVGELIKLDEEEGGVNKAIEVFLAERTRDWGEESSEWRWDEVIKEGKEERGTDREKEEKGTQTRETGAERERIATLVKNFLNLMKEDGLLPLPKELSQAGVRESKEGWKPGGGMAFRPTMDKATPGGVSPYLPRLEGSTVVHPCCRTTCSVLTASVANPNATVRFGVRKQ